MTLRLRLGEEEPRVAPTAWIAPGVVLTGAVEIGEDATLWFGVVARGENDRIAVGARANVQDACVLHSDPGFPLVLGADVVVGHGAIVHGCRVGDGALVGIGAIVLTGAEIGPGATIAAGALVREGQRIPPRALAVGVPARVVREDLEPAAPAIARSYRERARRYAAALAGA